MKPTKETETNKLKVITKKTIKNKIRKKDKIIFHDGEGEFPFGFTLSDMPRDCFRIYKAGDMFDKKGSLTGVSINLEFTVDPRIHDGFDVPKNVIVIFNRSRERDDFFTIHLSDSVISKFNIVGNDFTLVKCRIDRSIVKIYLSKPIDVAKKPSPGTVKFFHDVILFSDDLNEKILEFANGAGIQEGPKKMKIEIEEKETTKLQIYDRKIDADQACWVFWNAGFNYKDIEVRDYSTVKVKVVNPEKVKDEGGFWSIYGGGEKQWTNNFHVGDIGYIAVAVEAVPEIKKWGLDIIEVKK